MAVIQYTGIVNQIRGKLNGSTFNKARNANTLQRKQQSPRGNSGYQPEIRQVFASAQRFWKQITGATQALWQVAATNNPARDRFGNLVILSGYNKYIQAAILDAYGENAGINTPDPNPAPAAGLETLTLSLVNYSTSPAGTPLLHVEGILALDDVIDDIAVIMDVSLPIGPGVTVYYKRYSWFFGQAITSSISLNASQDLGVKYPMPYPGQQIIIRTRLLYYGNGSVVNTYFNRLTPTLT